MGLGLELYELPPSPNNMKARIALAFKKLDYERHRIMLESYPGDRSALVRISGQPLTPVLLHEGRAVFDSGAILRYLEANFRDTAPLFSSDFEVMRAIEEWEWFARSRLSEPVGMVFRAVRDPEAHPDLPRRASERMHELTELLEDQLTKTPFLVHDALSAADVTAAPLVYHAMLPEEAAVHPISRFFRESLHLGENRPRTRAWVQKVMAYDPFVSHREV